MTWPWWVGGALLAWIAASPVVGVLIGRAIRRGHGRPPDPPGPEVPDER